MTEDPVEAEPPPPRFLEIDHVTNCDTCGIKGAVGYDCPRAVFVSMGEWNRYKH
jgi:hypothetical protein